MSLLVNFSDFLEKYPMLHRISKGVYGDIYETTNNRIIKAQKIGSAFITELSVMIKYSHPCLYKIEAISFNSSRAFFVMKKGKSLYDALIKKEISIEEILTDLIEGISFLHKNGIVHCDIKKYNLLYDPEEKRLKIIDFGISRFGDYHPERGFYFTGVAYSNYYRDPEFREMINNSFSTELYSIAALVFFLFNSYFYRFYFDFSFLKGKKEYFLSHQNIESVISFLNDCQSFLEERKSIEELMQHSFIIRDRINLPYTANKSPDTFLSLSSIEENEIISTSISDLRKVAEIGRYSRSVVSNTMYLYSECISGGIEITPLLIRVCFYISLSLKSLDFSPPPEEIVRFCSVFPKICEVCGCSFFRMNNSLSYSDLIEGDYYLSEDERHHLNSEEILCQPFNFSDNYMRESLDYIFNSRAKICEDVSRLVVLRKSLPELEVNKSISILRWMVNYDQRELIRRLLGWDINILMCNKVIARGSVNIFSFKNEEELDNALSPVTDFEASSIDDDWSLSDEDE